MAQFLVLFVLFALPFVYAPFIQLAFEPPKVILFEVLTAFLLVISLFETKKVSIKSPRWIITPILIIVAVSIIHLFLNPSQLLFLGNKFRLQGTMLLWTFLFFAYVSSFIKIDKKHLVSILSLFGMLLAALVIGTNQSGRWIGTLGEPNALAAVAVFWLSVCLADKRKTISTLGVLVAIILVALSGSLSGVLAIFLQTSFIILISIVKLNPKKTLILIVLFLAFCYMLPLFQKESIFENRREIWKTAIVASTQRPFLGTGFGSIEITLEETAQKLGNTSAYTYIDSGHNIFLDWLIQGGIIGLIAFAYILFRSLNALVEKGHLYLAAGMIGILTVASFNPLSVASYSALWWIIGQGFSSHT